MPFNSNISRSDAQALVPENVSKEIIKATTESSAVLNLARRLQDMPTNVTRLPVVSVLPTAYFVSPGASDDTGRKQTTEMDWSSVYINAEEIAVIVPIPEAVLNDVNYDIWGESKPALIEAFGVVIDQAILYSTNKPSTWPTGIVPQATAAGNTVSLASAIDLYDALMADTTGVISKLELDGFFPNGAIASLSMRGKLRNARDADGQPLFRTAPAGAKFQYELDGSPLAFPRNGAIDAAQSLLVAGDWNQLVYSIRQDITWKILTEAVIQDSAGNIVYNLAQQDMVALRAVMRLGWQLPNPPNRIQPTAGSRSQFAVLTA